MGPFNPGKGIKAKFNWSLECKTNVSVSV